MRLEPVSNIVEEEWREHENGRREEEKRNLHEKWYH